MSDQEEVVEEKPAAKEKKVLGIDFPKNVLFRRYLRFKMSNIAGGRFWLQRDRHDRLLMELAVTALAGGDRILVTASLYFLTQNLSAEYLLFVFKLMSRGCF